MDKLKIPRNCFHQTLLKPGYSKICEGWPRHIWSCFDWGRLLKTISVVLFEPNKSTRVSEKKLERIQCYSSDGSNAGREGKKRSIWGQGYGFLRCLLTLFYEGGQWSVFMAALRICINMYKICKTWQHYWFLPLPVR